MMAFDSLNLSVDEGIFNAFAGIHTHLNKIFPSGLLFGHAELSFDIKLAGTRNPLRSCAGERHPDHFGVVQLRTSYPAGLGWAGRA